MSVSTWPLCCSWCDRPVEGTIVVEPFNLCCDCYEDAYRQAKAIEAWNASLPPAPTPDEIEDAPPYWRTRPKGAGP